MTDPVRGDAAEIVFPEAGIHQLIPSFSPRLLAHDLVKLLKRGQTAAAAQLWRDRMVAARLALRVHALPQAVEDAAIKTLTEATRREISDIRAKTARKPSAQIVTFRPRTGGGGQ